jgi:hypothetical protein
MRSVFEECDWHWLAYCCIALRFFACLVAKVRLLSARLVRWLILITA